MKLLLLLLLCNSLFATQSPQPFQLHALNSTTSNSTTLKESPLTNHFQATPNVNVITGEYLEEECDLIVASAEPIAIRRFYGHNTPYHPIFNFWRFNPEHFCIANFALQNPFIAVGYPNGNITSFDSKSPSIEGHSDFSFTPGIGFVHQGHSGQNHPANIKISYRKVECSSNTQHPHYKFQGEITDGAGGKKHFLSESHPWNATITEEVHLPDDDEQPTKGFTRLESKTAYPEKWTPFQLPIYEERKPNGNIVCYTYEHLRESTDIAQPSTFPSHSFLSTITTYNATKTKTLASVKFHYKRKHPYSLPEGIEVEGSDGRKIHYHYVHGNTGYCSFSILGAVDAPGAPNVIYNPEKTKQMNVLEARRIHKIARPEGRTKQIQFYKNGGKVEIEYAPLGPQGEMLPQRRYVYHDKLTEVFDAEGNKTAYRYDDKKRITDIEFCDKLKVIRAERMIIDPATGNIRSKRVEDGAGRLYSQVHFDYDEHQNVILETIGDEKEEYKIYRTFSKDGLNLLESERDDFQKKVLYSYKPGTNLLISELTYEGEKLKKRILHEYDDCAICFCTTVDDGDEGTYKKITSIKPKYEQPCFGLPEIVEEKTVDGDGKEILLRKVKYTYTPFGKIFQEDHYDATDTFRYQILNKYDEKERLSLSTDALGNVTHYHYDANNNLVLIEGPRKDQRKEIDYDKMNRPICFREQIEPGNFLVGIKQYDKAGRVTLLKDVCGHTTFYECDSRGLVTATFYPNGTERKEYDPLGNVIKEIDANGHETRKTYNFRNQVRDIFHPDGTKEHFTYNPNGTLSTYIDKNGAKSITKSDIFGHPLETCIYSPTGKLLKKTSATYNAFVKLTEQDGEGNETKYTYDHAGRKIGEKKGTKTIKYTYDALGRLSETRDGIAIHMKEYDLQGNILEERVEEESGRVLRKVAYKYDPAGNRTEVITSKGIFETNYNALGLPLSKKDPLGHTTTYGYSYKHGFRKWEKDPLGITVTLHLDDRGWERESITHNASNKVIKRSEKEYDKVGNLIEEKNHLFEGERFLKTTSIRWDYGPCKRLERLLEEKGKETLYLYDAKGRLEQTIKPDKKVIRHTYDDLGRLLQITSTGLDYLYEYDGNDRVKSVENPSSKIHTYRKYDVLGNIVEDHSEHRSGGSHLVSVFDASGRRKEVILPDETSITYNYLGDHLSSVKRGKYEHRYVERDLEGNLAQAELAGSIGSIRIERDALSRWKKFSTDHYSAFFDADAYDAKGNLKKYRTMDGQGEKTYEYSYDDLHQLVKENDHAFRFDSLNHRLSKNEIEEDVNALGQITKAGAVEYKYDLCGNLISDGRALYFYDALDRLIRIEMRDQIIEYEYDAFHRRLFKKINGTLIENYLWDGDNEIGSLDAWGEIKELRVLGEGMGAEIGSAVLLELEGKTFVPIHDHRGSLVVLVDVKSKKPVETYVYTAFGEENSKNSLSPWRFCSKRRDAETGFLYFGRRYYSPGLGRWISPDPLGFHDGANLYAYVHNNPLTHLDLYGLKGLLNCMYDWITDRPQQQSESRSAHHCNHYYPDFEKRCRNRSCTFDLDRPRMSPGLGMGFYCGMGNQKHEAKGGGMHISDLSGGSNVQVLYHASQGVVPDVGEAILEVYYGKVTTSVVMWMNSMHDFFKENPKGYFLQFCHSRGAAGVRNGLMHLPPEIRNRIMVVAIAPACYIDPKLCLEISHYRSTRDFVPHLDPIGRDKQTLNTTVLTPHKDAKFFDHEFKSPTYKDAIREEFRYFIDKYGER